MPLNGFRQFDDYDCHIEAVNWLSLQTCQLRQPVQCCQELFSLRFYQYEIFQSLWSNADLTMSTARDADVTGNVNRKLPVGRSACTTDYVSKLPSWLSNIEGWAWTSTHYQRICMHHCRTAGCLLQHIAPVQLCNTAKLSDSIVKVFTSGHQRRDVLQNWQTLNVESFVNGTWCCINNRQEEIKLGSIF